MDELFLLIFGSLWTIVSFSAFNACIPLTIDKIAENHGKQNALYNTVNTTVTALLSFIFGIIILLLGTNLAAEKRKNAEMKNESLLIIATSVITEGTDAAIKADTVDIINKLTSEIRANVVFYNDNNSKLTVGFMKKVGIEANILGIIEPVLKKDLGESADIIGWFNTGKVYETYKKLAYISPTPSKELAIIKVNAKEIDELTIKKVKLRLSIENVMAYLPRSIATCKYETSKGITFGGQTLQKIQ